MTFSPETSRVRRNDFFILVLCLAVLFFGTLGLRPLSNPDEGRYSEIPREMVETGDYVTPRLNGVKYFEKPPLLYWTTAASFHTLGESEFSARFSNALVALLGVALTLLAARKWFGRTAGFAAGISLASSFMYFVLSQIVLTDMMVAVMITGTLLCFLLGVEEPRGKRRFGYFVGLYVFMALAVLSKGLIGILLPGAVMFLWLLLRKRWTSLWPFYPISGVLLVLAIAAPWHVLAAERNHDFLQFYFVHEHWERFFTKIHGRFEPWWFFIPFAVVGFFPWIFAFFPALRESLAKSSRDTAAQRDRSWFFLIWILFIILFFSRSQSKLAPYILPIFPAMALLSARYLADLWKKSRELGRSEAWLSLTMAVISLVLLLGSAAFWIKPELTAKALKYAEPFERPLLPWLFCLLGLFGALFVFLQRKAWLAKNQQAYLFACLGWMLTLLFSANSIGKLFDNRSTKPLSNILLEKIHANDRLYHVGDYAQDMPFYLDRQVSVVEKLSEMEFGVKAEPEKTASRYISYPEFFRQWNLPGRAYAVVRRSDVQSRFLDANQPCKILGSYRKYTLISNER